MADYNFDMVMSIVKTDVTAQYNLQIALSLMTDER